MIVLARQWAERCDTPVRGGMSATQDAGGTAIAAEWPGTPHRSCHNHCLRDVAQPVREVDSRAQGTMRRTVRGLRAIERRVLADRRHPAASAPPPLHEPPTTAAAQAPAPCTSRDLGVVRTDSADVELLEGGKAKVASQSNGTTKYFVVNGMCECPDAKKAPDGWCKHRLSAAIAKRATTLAKQRLEQLDGNRNGQHAAEQSKAEAAATLPEAPASCNVYVAIAGRKVQVTLRDSDKQRMLARLEKLLQRFPAGEEGEQEPPEGWCGKHDVQMTQHHNKKGSWWSHKTAEGWCHGKQR